MSWHYLQEQAEEFSAERYLDGVRSERLKLMSTHGGCCCTSRRKETCHGFRSGMISAPLTGHPGAGSSTLSAEDSPARISAPQEKAQELKASAPAYGLKCTELFAKYVHGTRSWRTVQCSLDGGWEEYSETWPRQGIMLHGACWELPMLALRTGGTGYGSLHLMPTPTCCNAPNTGGNTHGPKALLDVARTGWNPGETWPTPNAGDGTRNAGSSLEARRGHQINLIDMVMHREREKLLPTPLATDAKNNGGPGQQRRHTPQLGAVVGGALNPNWVEWLMGWPLGWTDCDVLGTARFRSWLRRHSVS